MVATINTIFIGYETVFLLFFWGARDSFRGSHLGFFTMIAFTTAQGFSIGVSPTVNLILVILSGTG